MRSGILPDADLHAGVDAQLGLPRLVRVHRAARAGILAAAAAVVVTAPVRGGLAVVAALPVAVLAAARSAALVLLVVCALLLGWARGWLRRLPEPFRYACTIDAFQPPGGPGAPAGTASLHHDLAGRLTSRHPRLGLHAPGVPDPGDAHTVHVGGVCLLRTGRDGSRYVEVQPSVRVGAGRMARAAAPACVEVTGDGPSPDAYATLLDRLCASVTEELYRQLEEHATDRIASLPTRHGRGRALCHEAEDHARSGAPSAHDRARRLYAHAAERLDPGPRPLSPTALRRAVALAAVAAFRTSAFLRRTGARALPRLAERDVLWARCQLGSAAAVLARRILTGLPGLERTTVYEAQPLVLSALSRLESLPAGVPGREGGLVDGHVLLAHTLVHLGDRPRARHHLELALAADASRAGVSPAAMVAAGELDEHPAIRMRQLRRAAALDPGSQTVQWLLALETERAWRSADDLDPTVAESVVDAYRSVLALEPGHLGAWTAIAYVRWLLGQVPDARGTLEAARRARPHGGGTFGTEFALGCARVAAESGRFDEAYRHARQAVAGLVAEGVPQLPDGEPRTYGFWYYARSPAVLERCRRYRATVTEHRRRAQDAGSWSEAVLDTVDAFVWYDLGECLRHAGRLDEAEQAFLRASAAGQGFVLADLQLSDLYRRQGDERRAARAAAAVARCEPSWETGALARALGDAGRAAAAHRRAARAARTASQRESARSTLLGRRLLSGAVPAPGGAPPPAVMSVLAAARHAARDGSPDGPATTAGGAAAPDDAGRATGGTPRRPEEAGSGTGLRRIDEEIADHRRRSGQQAALAQRAAVALRATIPTIVPHGWLWQHPEGGDGFDWLALNPPDPRQERRWERQLDERQAVALYLYASAWLRFPPEEVREELAYQRAAALLRCVRERFLPRNRAVVVDLLVAEAAVGAPARVSDLVAEVARGTDEEARGVLGDVLAGANEARPDWQADVLVAACGHEGFSPTLSAWVADQALSRVVPRVDPDRATRLAAAARGSFRRALRSKRATDLLVAGEGLSELCDPEHAARAYRAVLDPGADADGCADADGAESHGAESNGAGAETGPAREALARRAALRLAALDFLAGRGTPSEGEASPGGGGAALTRAMVARAVGDELARAGRRPCTDAATLDAGYEYARLWVAAERQAAARADDDLAWRDAEAARLALVAARPPSVVAPWLGDRSVGAMGKGGHDRAAPGPPDRPRIAVEVHPDLGRDDATGGAPTGPRGAGTSGAPAGPRGDGTSGAPTGLRAYVAAAKDARRDVSRRFGVGLSEVVWRDAAELPPGGYRFVFDGLPVASGRVEPRAVFVPTAAGNGAPMGSRPADWDPWPDGGRGAWAPAVTATDDAEHWEPAEYLGRHLGACLRERLAMFLGVQEVADALAAWSAHRDGATAERERAVAVLHSGPELRTLTVCLRALVREHVPIQDLDPLVEAYRRARRDGADVCEVVRRLRQSVRARLPGNAPGWQRRRLPEELEHDIRRLTGPNPGAIPAEALDAVLAATRQAIGAGPRRPVAVVTDPVLRLDVRWLVAVEHPWVPVLAEDEVVTTIRLPDDPPAVADRSEAEWTW